MRRFVSTSRRGLQSRGFAGKAPSAPPKSPPPKATPAPAAPAAPAAAAAADPWANAPRQEAQLREAILKATPSGAAGSPGAQLAKALYTATELAKAGQKDATNLHEVVAKDLKAVAGALAMPEWLTFFKSPIIAREARLDTLNEFFTKLGASEITRRFFSQLVDSKLTKHVPAMVTAYQEIVRSHRSEVEATVVTAKPLTPYERQTLIDDIADEYLEIGKKLILTEEVDESLLGGYTLMLGTRYFDYSVKSRMDEIIEQYRALVQGAHEKEMQRFNKI